VDDLPDMCKALAKLLQAVGYSSPFATSAGQAMELLSVDPLPDLIVLDYMMPEIDGLQLLRRIRVDRRTAAIPR
jgi:CheY-like chemotaxis protein